MMLPSSWRDRFRMSFDLAVNNPFHSSTVSVAINFFPDLYHPIIGCGRAPRTSHIVSKRWPSFNGPSVDPLRITLSSLCSIKIADGGTMTRKSIRYSPVVSQVSNGSRYVISHEYSSSSSIWTALMIRREALPERYSMASLLIHQGRPCRKWRE